MKILNFVAVLILGLFMIGCNLGEDVDKESCQNSSNSCGEFETCCSASQCRYLYNGEEFPCDGTDCAEAAKELSAKMCTP